MIYVVMKHFAMDDIPVCATTDKDMATALEKQIDDDIERGPVLATEQKMLLAACDISTGCLFASVVTFAADGGPVVE